MTDKAYSINDEDFIFTDAWDALDALAQEGLLCEGQVYYEVDTAPIDPCELLRAERILEEAEERLYDEIGEAADNAYNVDSEAIAELDAALKTWAAKHLSDVRLWRCVGDSREVKVTAAEVAEYAR
jgi:hypothetical protein